MEEAKKRSEAEELAFIKQRLQMGSFGPGALKEGEESKEKRILLNKKNLAEQDRKDFIQGYESALKLIEQEAKAGVFNTSEEAGTISVEECALPEEFRKIIETSELWKEPYEKHELISLSGFSSKIVLNFYSVGINLFDEKKYKESLSVFTFLSILNPEISAFWVGKGLCYEGDLAYDKAIEEFAHAIEADSSEFEPFLGIMRCSQQLKDYSKLIELLNAQKENEAIKDEVAEALEYIDSVKNNHS